MTAFFRSLGIWLGEMFFAVLFFAVAFPFLIFLTFWNLFVEPYRRQA